MTTRIAALLFLLAVAAPVHAHALGVSATIHGNRVEVEAYYSDDTPARDAAVMVNDHAGWFVATGRTDEQGKWTFPLPRPGPITIIVDAGAGHRVTKSIVVPAVLPPGPTGPVADGPSREEFTRFPWLRLAAGLAIIAALAAGWLALRRGVGKMPGPSNEQGEAP
jgi:nickel transport protein